MLKDKIPCGQGEKCTKWDGEKPGMFVPAMTHSKYCCVACRDDAKRKNSRDYNRRRRNKMDTYFNRDVSREKRTYKAGRLCANEKCRKKLSMYNKGKLCFACKGELRGVLGRGSAPSVNQGRGFK